MHPPSVWTGNSEAIRHLSEQIEEMQAEGIIQKDRGFSIPRDIT